MMTKAISGVILTLLTIITLSTQECINEYGRTKCWNLLPLTEEEPIIFDDYLIKFELENYTGPLTKSMFKNLPLIEQLSFTNCEITAIEGEVFCSLPKLKFIFISDSKLPNITVNTFGTCCHMLHTLGIQTSVLDDIAPGSFQYLNQLDILSIQHSTLSMLRTDAFTGLSHMQHLSLKGNRITHVEDGAFNDLLNLRLLNLNDNRLREVPVAALKQLTSLEDLYLSGNEITDFDVNELLPDLPRLVFMSFYFNKVSCEQLKQIAKDLVARNVGKQAFQADCMGEAIF